MSRLAEVITRRQFAITAEIVPPVSADAKDVLSIARVLDGHVDAINVTDGAGARAHISSLAASAILVRNGIEPVLQLTCRDRNRIALQGDLLGAAALGIENILILSGDDPSSGDQPDAKPVFDLDSRSLMLTAQQMCEAGTLPTGREISTPPHLFIGGADAPSNPAAGKWTADGLKPKIEAGASFVQTQFCYDVDLVRRYAASLLDTGVAPRCGVLIGLGPLASARSARWMRDKLWGTVIPDDLITRLEQSGDERQEGIAICAELMQSYAEINGIAGVHLMAPVNFKAIPETIERCGLRSLSQTDTETS